MKTLITYILILSTSILSAQWTAANPLDDVRVPTEEDIWYPTERGDDYVRAYIDKVEALEEYNLEAWIDFMQWDLRYQGMSEHQDSWNITSVDISFRDLSDGVFGHPIGVATGMFQENRVEIQIDPYYWARLTTQERLFVIYHEAGHDYWEIWHNEIAMLSPALSIVEADISWSKFLDWRDEMFLHIAEKNCTRLENCPEKDVSEEAVPSESATNETGGDQPSEKHPEICNYEQKDQWQGEVSEETPGESQEVHKE